MSKRLRYALYVAGLTGLWWVMGGRAWYADRLIDTEYTDTKNFAVYETVKHPKDADGKSAKIDIRQISNDEFSIENGQYLVKAVNEVLEDGNPGAGTFPPLRIERTTY